MFEMIKDLFDISHLKVCTKEKLTPYSIILIGDNHYNPLINIH